MAWTQSDVDELKAAIMAAASGKRVRYKDREVERQDLSELRGLLADMQQAVNAASGHPSYAVIATNKGFDRSCDE